MGLKLVEFSSVGAGVELEAKGVDVGVVDVDGCEDGLAEEVLRIELVADVVVASTVFGTANRLSVAARFPQAM